MLIFTIAMPIISAQNNRIEMKAQLDTHSQSFKIEQRLTYVNHSQDTLKSIYLHDWNNAFSDKNSVLGKRFQENYNKKFFFAKESERGFTTIYNITSNFETITWERENQAGDFIKVLLKNDLAPTDSVTILLNYKVKIPDAKFTSYGIKDTNYNLRYWYLIPVVYDKEWETMHHLDMDDLYQSPTDYTVSLILPQNYVVNSNLAIEKKTNTTYQLFGKNRQDIELHLSLDENFDHFQTEKILITTNLNNIEIGKELKEDILNRQLTFLQDKLGPFPHRKLFINKTSYYKNPLYGMNQLPSFLRPFSDTFEWDLRMFKVLIQRYIENSLQSQTREDTWLRNGLQSYIMMQYINTYYPDVKLIGGLSKIWGIRSYQFSALQFNDRYDMVYQYIARSNNDQVLRTPSDSLTNFNRLIFSKYKSAMALDYLDDYLGDRLVARAIKQHFQKNILKNNKDVFEQFIRSNADKDVDWFFDELLIANKKVDFSIEKRKRKKDSLVLRIKNKKNSGLPLSIYGINKDGIQTKKWLTDIDSTITITVPKENTTHWVLNYEKKVLEMNPRNNTENTNWSLFKKPLKIRWLQDAEAPNHTQLFIEPKADYNFYDGVIIAASIKNKSSLHKNFIFSLTPSYSFKSESFTGYFKLLYHKYIESEVVSSYRAGLIGSYFHYQPELAYKKLNPYAQVFFKRKNLRSVKNSSASISYIMVDKEIDLDDNAATDFDKYNVLNLNYSYSNPAIIDNFSFFSNLEFGSKFSKLSTDVRFRKLTNNNQQFDARLFAGVFFHNKSTSDYFSFGVNRPHDYLFRYRYFGREETEGILSQQIIINDGGFKSQIPVGYANQWISSLNTSIGLWRWLEVYNDVGLVKNRNESVYFVHDKGIRLNFIHNILEVYLPMHSNNGWEISQPNYEEKIRFVFKGDMASIYGFLRRGFL